MRLLILGNGVSGRGATRLATRLGHDVVVYDRDPACVADLELTTHHGDWQSEWFAGVDTVIASPGIPEHAEPIVEALRAGIPVWGELEFAARHLDLPLVAVTGTNGKTTVTTVIGDMLAASGLRATTAGNIGTALTDFVGSEADVIVVEASSFQLRFIDQFVPNVAVLLNIAPDHLDWHQTFEAYRAAKANLVRNADSSVPLIFDADDAEASLIARTASTTPIPVSGIQRSVDGWGVDGDRFILPGMELSMDRLPVGDPAFLLDLAAAGAAALAAGGDVEAVARTIEAFEPTTHRRTLVGSWNGVAWVNDSKATNPHSALAALDAYPSVVVIAGGRNKDLDVAPIAQHRNVRAVVAIGEAGPDILAAATVPSKGAGSMTEAVSIARGFARSGDTVLLAPGCASFDMFDSYAHRGDTFRQAVLDQEEGE